MNPSATFRCEACGQPFTIEDCPPESVDHINRDPICEPCWERREESTLAALPLWAHPDGGAAYDTRDAAW